MPTRVTVANRRYTSWSAPSARRAKEAMGAKTSCSGLVYSVSETERSRADSNVFSREIHRTTGGACVSKKTSTSSIRHTVQDDNTWSKRALCTARKVLALRQGASSKTTRPLSRTTRPRDGPQRLNQAPAGSSPVSVRLFARRPMERPHAQPSACRTAPWYCCSHRLHVATDPISVKSVVIRLVASPSATKTSPAPPSTTHGQETDVPRHEHPRTRPALRFPMEGRCRCTRGPRTRRHARRSPRGCGDARGDANGPHGACSAARTRSWWDRASGAPTPAKRSGACNKTQTLLRTATAPFRTRRRPTAAPPPGFAGLFPDFLRVQRAAIRRRSASKRQFQVTHR